MKKMENTNKFYDWIEKNDKKQVGVAKKLGISTATLNEILRIGRLPSLKLAYDIEKYTQGQVTVYDWIDENSVNGMFLNTKKKSRNTKRIDK